VGTANLIDVALSAGVKKICHVSSIAALGKDTVITEKTIWDKKHSHSVYGESKHESELEAWRGIAEGLETIIVNPSVIIGPWKVHTGIGKFFMQIQKGLKYYTGGSNGFVDVRDVAKIMVLLMEGDFKNESFLVSGSNVSFRNLSEIISKLLGTMAPARNAPVFLTDIACRLSQLKALVTGQPSGFDRDTARISQTTSIYSNQKITEALHFSFIPIEQSLSHYYKFYKVHETFH
jgi:nucleoside-diphosphate-sugar epimerase